MLWAKDNKDRVYFDRIVSLNYGNAMNHQIHDWLLKAYNDDGHGKNLPTLDKKQMAQALFDGFKNKK